MNSIELLLKEIKKRATPKLLIESLFDKQMEVYLSKKRKRAILTSRRAGKSQCVLTIFLIYCLSNKDSRCLYLALTYKNVKRIAFDILNELIKKYTIDCKINRTELTFEFNNGSIIELGGADTTLEQTERYLGAKFDNVCIDEAASFDAEILDYLIDVVLNPTLIDKRGTLILTGTPRIIESGRFYEVTTKYPKDWDVFEWNTLDNPYVKENWELEINDLKEQNPDIENLTWFIREYLGKWCKDTSNNVYKIYSNNIVKEIIKGEHNYILGIDIGWNDACAFVVSSYVEHDPNFYIHESYKKSEMLIDDIVNQIRYYDNIYNNLTYVADSANKTVIMEIQNRYGISILPAEKTNKYDWIEVFNNEASLGKIKILNSNKELLKEIDELPWKYDKMGKRSEHPAFDNHLADAELYAYRHAYHYLQEPIKELTINEKMIKMLEKRMKKKEFRRY